MDQFMRRAVELSAQNVREGGEPFGAVLVKEGKIVSEGVNTLHETYDISGHAEMVAIRKAQKELQTHDLSGYIMYASGEPCPMCLTSMYLSGISEGYYCASIEDTASYAGLGSSVSIYAELKKNREDRLLKMKPMPLEEGQEDPMQLYADRVHE